MLEPVWRQFKEKSPIRINLKGPNEQWVAS